MASAIPARTDVDEAAVEASQENVKAYARFDLSQRIEHAILLVSFTILGVTGLAQKFASTPGGETTLRLLGGIESSRLVHRWAAVALLAVSIYHIVAVLYRILVRRTPLSMLPVPQDFTHLYHDLLYYLGRRARKAYYGRYSYAEKVEYLAVVWGTLIMAITGFMMWNPIATTRWLPGDFIPAAKAAHGGEALLAVLAIILWHFYHVHIRHLNRSMFTGKLTEAEMQHEHPAELAQLKTGQAGQPLPPSEVRRRQRVFFPIAVVLVVTLGYGLVRFVTFEQTAISTVPRGETAPIFVPVIPTPTPTPLPSPTPLPGLSARLSSWEDGIAQVFNDRCGTCHVQSAFGNLSLAAYQEALTGGQSGPAIVPGDPESSLLVQVQSAGGHPAQLSSTELEAVIEWIKAGALEK